MDIRKYFQNCFLAIFVIIIHQVFCALDELDYEDGPPIGRCPWIRNKLKNGRVRYRYKGRVAKFLCDSGYELAGKRSSTCVRGQWSNPIPVCVARGCNRVPSITNGRVTEMYRGALLVYDCNPGYTLTGDISIHCDGRRWNASPPVCEVNPDVQPETSCDFESPYLCGWSHDPTHVFDWKRNQFATPSGHVGTGPSHDHTFGENKAGYYMYIEASSPRKINDTARLFSPVYPAQESGGCFTFWYHMFGATTGGLRVYFKPESHVFGELSPKWKKFGDQGNQWLRGNISVPTVNENFQIVIEGIRGESYVGDSAIDDVQLTQYDCQTIDNLNDTTTEGTSVDSCRGRCRTSSQIEGSCECKESCVATESCCNDYHTLCFDGNEPIENNTYEPEPGDYYGKTASPLILAPTLSSSTTTTEAQALTDISNIVSNLTSESFTTSFSSSAAPEATSTVIQTSNTVHSSSTISSLAPTTNARRTLSTSLIPSTEPIAVTGTSFSITTPSTETNSGKYSTENSGEILKTTSKLSTFMSTTTFKTSSKPTVKKSTRSTTKTPILVSYSTPKISLSTTLKPTQSTTKTSTTQKSTTTTPTTSTQRTSTTTATTSTQRTSTTTPATSTQITTTTTTPVTSTQKTTTTTPVTSTQKTTTTNPVTSTQKTTTTTPMTTTRISTSEMYRTTTPLTTTVKQSSILTTSTAFSTTKSSPTHVPVIGLNSTSSTVLTTTVSSTVSPNSVVPDITTPRYHLRPGVRTSLSTSTILNPTTATYSSTKLSPFTLGSTASTSKTQLSTLSSTISRGTLQTRRWGPYGPFRPTLLPSTKLSTTTSRMWTSIAIQSSRGFSTTTLPSAKLSTTIRHKWIYSREPSVYSSSPTTSDSYRMVTSKTERSKSNGNSTVIIGVVVFIIICIVGGVAFYIRRNKQKRLSKLEDDSEMRFLPDSDYMDYSDASSLDRILMK